VNKKIIPAFSKEDDDRVWQVLMNKIKPKPYYSEEDTECWKALNWRKIVRMAKKFQRRIVKAYQEKNNDKLAALQWLMTRSFSARALAVLTVTESKGKRTPGIDGVRWVQPDQKYRAILKLEPDAYIAKPYLRVDMKKKGGGTRPLSIPSFSDRAMQTLYKMALDPIAECSSDTKSFGYRTWRSTHNAMEECRRVLSAGAEWVIEGDIKGCFDNINHEWLLDNIPMERKMLRKFIKNGHKGRRGNEINKWTTGISQGGAISSLLCNMTLDGLQGVVKKHDSSMELLRYADDLVILGKDIKSLHDGVLSGVCGVLGGCYDRAGFNEKHYGFAI
jgi:RNA-directed DNA polymerase